MDAINSIFKELENNRKLIGNNTFDQLERIQVASQFKLNSLEKAMSSGIDDEINKTQIDFITFVRRFKRMVNDIWNDLKEKLPSPEPTQPSPEPTQPSPEPTQPSPEPTQPSPEPTQPSPEPTQPSPEPNTQQDYNVNATQSRGEIGKKYSNRY